MDHGRERRGCKIGNDGADAARECVRERERERNIAGVRN